MHDLKFLPNRCEIIFFFFRMLVYRKYCQFCHDNRRRQSTSYSFFERLWRRFSIPQFIEWFWTSEIISSTTVFRWCFCTKWEKLADANHDMALKLDKPVSTCTVYLNKKFQVFSDYRVYWAEELNNSKSFKSLITVKSLKAS